jgi:hypothetical protein
MWAAQHLSSFLLRFEERQRRFDESDIVRLLPRSLLLELSITLSSMLSVVFVWKTISRVWL